MELSEALNRRRSIRSYTGQVVDPEQLEAILTAAYEAPIGMGRYESIHLTVVTRPSLLAAIDAAAARMFGNPDAHPLYGAPMLVVVSSDREGNVASANVAAVIQNMSLAAVDQGVGSCYIYGATRALAQDADLLAQLDLPEGFAPLGSIVLGKTDEKYEPRQVPAGHRFAQNDVA
ncbi:nitroreductase family protein [Parafannyhessea umbonata]|uniref:Nitroreductase n=1 Tax=Parafannyhessea umbonata TaxID=604330 RepID=A0A1H1KS89_9ACTN|nr:nitroreductase family protein [Parafannyhessea umbonata]SDR64890.1 Nitroreductase [Parafannyhessea umbonata]